MARCPVIVVDTNVWVSALRSRRGASFGLLAALPDKKFEAVISVPLVMEYESVLHRPGLIPLHREQIDAVLDMLCSVARFQSIHFLWRPQLADPKDEMVLETAVNAAADFLVTHNVSDFAAASKFDLAVVTPRQFLDRMEGLKS